MSTNNQTSETPRTDDLLFKGFRNHDGWRNHPFAVLSRQLERELAEARADAQRLDWLEQKGGGVQSIYFNDQSQLNPASLCLRAAIDLTLASIAPAPKEKETGA